MTVPPAPGPAHALLAPSSADIWGALDGCPGSVVMQQLYPDPEESPEAREGTAAHWYVTETLQGRDPGPAAPNGVPITAEMVDCAQGLLIDVRDTLAAHPGATLRVEQRVYMPIVHDQNWGTPDVVLIDHAQRFVAVWDYKYGHRYVPPWTLQLVDYAIGVLREVAPCADWPAWRVSLNIAQPRNFHVSGPVREWQITGGKLLDEFVPQLYEAARLAMAPNPPTRSGEHCRDCSARHACETLQRAGAIAMDVAGQVSPVDLTPHALGLELRQIRDAIKRLEARSTGLEEMALATIRGGVPVPFFTTEYTNGREKWAVPAAEIFALGDLMGVPGLRKPDEAVTPQQARDAFKRARVDAAVINAYAERPRGALRLTPVADNAAKLAFE